MDNDVRNRIAMNLYYWREGKRKITIHELSKLSGVTKNQIMLIESEKANATIDTLEKLAFGLKIDVSKLIKKVK